MVLRRNEVIMTSHISNTLQAVWELEAGKPGLGCFLTSLRQHKLAAVSCFSYSPFYQVSEREVCFGAREDASGAEEVTLCFHPQAQLCLSRSRIHKLAPLPAPESKHSRLSRTPLNFPHSWSSSEQASAVTKCLTLVTRAWNGYRAGRAPV